MNTSIGKDRVISKVWDFMLRCDLVPSSGHVAVALSGGVDSMVLLTVLAQLRYQGKINKIDAIHINHGTRPENDGEALFVQNEAEALHVYTQINCIDLRGVRNFEKRARDERYQVFNAYLDENPQAALCMGHHIDDSFEWSLMQQFKSSTIRPTLGIPVKRGRIVRPLMALSRIEIEQFAQRNNIHFVQDPTNSCLEYDRNYVRNELVPKIMARFPRALENYAARSNRMADTLDISAVAKSRFIPVVRKECTLLCDETFARNMPPSVDQIESSIYRHSSSERGELRDQIERLKEAYVNGKQGPLSFSGGVSAYLARGMILFASKSWEPEFSEESTENRTLDTFETEFKKRLRSNPKGFPFWVALSSEQGVVRKSPSNHPLQCDSLQRDGHICVTASELLHLWQKNQKWRTRPLKLSFLFNT